MKYGLLRIGRNFFFPVLGDQPEKLIDVVLVGVPAAVDHAGRHAPFDKRLEGRLGNVQVLQDRF